MDILELPPKKFMTSRRAKVGAAKSTSDGLGVANFMLPVVGSWPEQQQVNE